MNATVDRARRVAARFGLRAANAIFRRLQARWPRLKIELAAKARPGAADRLADALLAGRRAHRAIQRAEDPYSQGALNGHDFLWRLHELDPWCRRAIGEMISGYAMQAHKLAYVHAIMGDATGRMRQRIESLAYATALSTPDGRSQADAAMELYGAALAVDPGCAKAHLGLAGLLADRGDGAAAIGHFDRAAEHEAYYRPYADFRIAVLLDRSGDGAQAAFRRRRAADSGFVFGQYQAALAEGLRRDGDVERALKAFGNALDCAHFHALEFVVLDPAIEPWASANPAYARATT